MDLDEAKAGLLTIALGPKATPSAMSPDAHDRYASIVTWVSIKYPRVSAQASEHIKWWTSYNEDAAVYLRYLNDITPGG